MNFEFEKIKHLFKLDEIEQNDEQEEWEKDILLHNYIGGVKALNKFKLWEWVRTFQPTKGFCYSSDENVKKIMIETDGDGHSGVSFACMMRGLQGVACSLINESDYDRELCPICLEEDNEKKIVLECYHMFHVECIKSKNLYTCPLCRAFSIPGSYKNNNRMSRLNCIPNILENNSFNQ